MKAASGGSRSAGGSPWTVEMARTEAQRLLTEAIYGRDPATKPAGQAMTLAQLVGLYVREGCAHKKPSTLQADQSRITHHLLPLLGTRRIDSIQRSDVERLILSVQEGRTATPKPAVRGQGQLARGGRGAAAHSATLLKTLLAFAVRRDLLAINPAIGVKRPPGRKMERFLSDAEIGRLSVALDEYVAQGGSVHAAAAIRLLMQLRWSDFDLDRTLIFLPDSKTGRKPIYLSSPALTILRTIPRVDGNPHVIVGQKTRDHVKALGDIWYEVRQHAGLDDVRLHDLRHSFASIGAASSLVFRPSISDQ